MELEPHPVSFSAHENVYHHTDTYHSPPILRQVTKSFSVTLQKARLVYDPIEYDKHEVRTATYTALYTCRTYRWDDVIKYRLEPREVTVYRRIWVPEPGKPTRPKSAASGGASGPGGFGFGDLGGLDSPGGPRDRDLDFQIRRELDKLVSWHDRRNSYSPYNLDDPSDWPFDFDPFGPEPLEQLRVDPNYYPSDVLTPPNLSLRPSLPSRISPLDYVESLLNEFTNWLEANLLMDDEEYREYKKAVENALDAAKKAEEISGSRTDRHPKAPSRATYEFRGHHT